MFRTYPRISPYPDKKTLSHSFQYPIISILQIRSFVHRPLDIICPDTLGDLIRLKNVHLCTDFECKSTKLEKGENADSPEGCNIAVLNRMLNTLKFHFLDTAFNHMKAMEVILYLQSQQNCCVPHFTNLRVPNIISRHTIHH